MDNTSPTFVGFDKHFVEPTDEADLLYVVLETSPETGEFSLPADNCIRALIALQSSPDGELCLTVYNGLGKHKLAGDFLSLR